MTTLLICIPGRYQSAGHAGPAYRGQRPQPGAVAPHRKRTQPGRLCHTERGDAGGTPALHACAAGRGGATQPSMPCNPEIMKTFFTAGLALTMAKPFAPAVRWAVTQSRMNAEAT